MEKREKRIWRGARRREIEMEDSWDHWERTAFNVNRGSQEEKCVNTFNVKVANVPWKYADDGRNPSY